MADPVADQGESGGFNIHPMDQFEVSALFGDSVH